MPRDSHRPLVLLAEDSEDDAFFFRWTLKKCGLVCDLVHAIDGEQAVRILEAAVGPDGTRRERCPDLVFLDLKMPNLTGFEVLNWIRDHPVSPPLDVSVLSGSEHASDVERAIAMGASAYYVKPLTPEQLQSRFAAWRVTEAPGAAVSAAAPAGVSQGGT